MKIFPAIDLKNGHCVRLTQGDFAAVTVYESDPVKQAHKFAAAEAEWLHIVDLDGAKGGGIRDEKTIEELLGAGIKRVVVGSLAVKNVELVKSWLKKFGPDAIVLAFDVRLSDIGEPELLTHGWQAGSQISLWNILDQYADSGLKTILCTDVSRDGMLTGANYKLYEQIQMRWPKLGILASGGVSGLADLIKLARLNVAGAIVGKAIYEGRVDLAAAIKQVAHAG
ncbi:MAG TPA: 1-(5-phosphoribosyl)-5-[(5-phosphoribosylamino)methylideneamino] imidazole-4-carboxamide isomerase [Alphaproteobacteria bacterium]|nr:1-(5-phosphoribosyl)-5-[(5-phosphoribosylamino)methylideneamino] imidazole-4-carboxamide isomerase [Alphaproteobacteria bacterium]